MTTTGRLIELLNLYAPAEIVSTLVVGEYYDIHIGGGQSQGMRCTAPCELTTDTDTQKFRFYNNLSTWCLVLASGDPVAEQVKYGAVCSKCNEYNQYAEAKAGFTCFGCRR